MINDYISLHENQVMSGRIDERYVTGQNVLYQIRLTETVNKNRKLVDMDDLSSNRKQDGNRIKERKRRRENMRENKQITTAVALAGCWQEQILKLVVVYIFLSGRRRW